MVVKMKKIKKIIASILFLFLALFLFLNLYNFICLKILKQDLTSLFGYSVLEVVSGSMEPTLQVGDLIVIQTKHYQYQENDIVTFYDVNHSFVTHRIISLEKDQMITKGDNNNTNDEATATKNIVGKYLFKISGLGSVLTAFKNPLVSLMILVIGILVCYFITVEKDQEELVQQDETYQEFLSLKEQEAVKEKQNFLEKIKAKLPQKKQVTHVRKKNTKQLKRKAQKKKKQSKKRNQKKQKRG